MITATGQINIEVSGENLTRAEIEALYQVAYSNVLETLETTPGVEKLNFNVEASGGEIVEKIGFQFGKAQDESAPDTEH